jgi:hypothetical protein
MDQDELKALIAQQREVLEKPKTATVQVVLASTLVDIEVTKLMPDDWEALVAAHPVRPHVKADGNVGFDQDKLPRAYPADKIKVAGNVIDGETWREIFAVLDSTHRKTVTTIIWGQNVYEAVMELRDLGKAAAGRSSDSPANRASRRAASKAGSQRKSRATSTPQGN